MRLRLVESQRCQLEAWARECAPREACGLLLGDTCDGEIRVDRVTLGRNLAPEGIDDAFVLDPMHTVAVDRESRRHGCGIVGIWHSHPRSPAELSARDREHAARDWCHMVVSLASESVDIRTWRRDGAGFVQIHD